MKAASFDYHRGTSLADVVASLVADPDARPFLGGQSLSPTMNLRLARPARLIDLKPIGLRDFAADESRFHLGAGHTHAAIEDGLVQDMTRGLLPHVAAGIAYRGVRNRGTFGGSLAHADPAADWLTVLMLLNGSVHAMGPSGARAIAAADFVTGAYATALAGNEILTGCDLPRLSETARWGWCKVNRKTGAFADALGGAVLDGALCRVAVGAIDAAPMLLLETSTALRAGGVPAAVDVAPVECARLLTHLDADGRALRGAAVVRALQGMH
ncbi:FAD binding domain-containing protein [Humitalea sp. 24SJ18S-53]|uniref:FAD binding domain-containing protein n=1 Tax=Humitalea sp. 24SJ18S-53 TaxID=3422307 RepID=UPI003D66FD5D